MPQIKCSVRNCFFWGRGDVCEADAIEVAVTQGGPYVDAGSMGVRAGSSADTQCVTFRPREDEGVVR